MKTVCSGAFRLVIVAAAWPREAHDSELWPSLQSRADSFKASEQLHIISHTDLDSGQMDSAVGCFEGY